jgi:hypothetical protein
MRGNQVATTLSLTSIVRQSDEQVAADMDGEVALMSIETGKYYCLNSTGSRIWRLIDQPRRVAEVCAMLLCEFDVEPQRCESELLGHLAQLLEEKLIEVVDVAAA